MGTIISLSGSKAVGKTTLINGLRHTIPELIIREGFRQTDTGYSLDIETEYYKNQRWYISREIEEFKKYKSMPNPILLLRGPEDVEFYTFHYPKTKGYGWDIENNLAKELKELRCCRSDYIIYLDAPIEVIRSRKENDKTKPRKNMDNWLNYWQPFIDSYMKNIPYTSVFDTSTISAEELLSDVSTWIKERTQ